MEDKVLLQIRVVDVPTTATAQEAESLLNGIDGQNYYLDTLVFTRLPNGIGSRGVFKARRKPLTEKAVLTRRGRGNLANKDGMDAAAVVILELHPALSSAHTSKLLADHGINRSATWVSKKKLEMKDENGGTMPS